MIPRFVRTFLIISLLILVPTFYLLHRSYTSSSWTVTDRSQVTEEDVWGRQEHWDQGGQGPLGNRPEDDEMDRIDDGYVGVEGQEDGYLNEAQVGGTIMPKLGNATAKAELGRAAWKVLHTMTLRFPEKPNADERDALKSYLYLFSRLYPCGECAEEFQALLRDYPPQTSSRKSASLWLCSVHNMVNARLGKAEFDCNNLEGTYDCGCGPEAEDDETPTLVGTDDAAEQEMKAHEESVRQQTEEAEEEDEDRD